eukprot:gb/GECH01001352.1/.p1 GENE.gb/GECH01001352.1/~~gb/GECH01001352.1/.p1  ORF type:complete len:244 (+),score=74.23 gb/GECH01001352.1/:1-732(+)
MKTNDKCSPDISNLLKVIPTVTDKETRIKNISEPQFRHFTYPGTPESWYDSDSGLRHVLKRSDLVHTKDDFVHQMVKNKSQLKNIEKKSIAPHANPERNELNQKKYDPKDEKVTAGANWYHMPEGDATPETVQDLMAVRLAGLTQRRRVNKKAVAEAQEQPLPRFFQIGTVTTAASDYYASRAGTKKHRKRRLADQVLDDGDGDDGDEGGRMEWVDTELAKRGKGKGRKKGKEPEKKRRRRNK